MEVSILAPRIAANPAAQLTACELRSLIDVLSFYFGHFQEGSSTCDGPSATFAHIYTFIHTVVHVYIYTRACVETNTHMYINLHVCRYIELLHTTPPHVFIKLPRAHGGPYPTPKSRAASRVDG